MRHIPVLAHETIHTLALAPHSKIIDATLGDGGHSEYIFTHIPDVQILGIDTDSESLARAKKFLSPYHEQLVAVQGNFRDIVDIARAHQFVAVDAIIADLGWSSPQFAERNRGFSFQGDEFLDMRLGGELQGPNAQGYTTAADIINNASAQELIEIFRLYGDEKLAGPIVKKIIAAREAEKITTTNQLVAIIVSVYGHKKNTEKIHPATRVFQALRIAVNEEFDVLKQLLEGSRHILKPGGCIAIISFHSGEDRIIKHFFKKHSTEFDILTKKPICAGEKEIQENPRARSAKLRVAQKK